MKYILIFFFINTFFHAQDKLQLSDDIAEKLAEKPLQCINQEYPNKTAHIINNAQEALLTPQKLHPTFYGCFDWHSSVHCHWMLLKILKTKPNIANSAVINSVLDVSFSADKIKQEADYFTKYEIAQNFERTYGWAWILQLDKELATWDNPQAKRWHQNMKPLTDEILRLWKAYLPKQTYPNRTGVHPNTAFAMSFALDWARVTGDKNFEKDLIEKSRIFFLNDTDTPAYLEPDGSDFFSPSLEIADLMRRILPQKDFVIWLDQFYSKKSIENISKIPIVSDINDFQTVHLVGLSFSKAWCMKGIAKSLPDGHPLKIKFTETADVFLNNALPLVFEGNYGGDHWLSSFAVYALAQE